MHEERWGEIGRGGERGPGEIRSVSIYLAKVIHNNDETYLYCMIKFASGALTMPSILRISIPWW
jgi:hypothetical protein